MIEAGQIEAISAADVRSSDGAKLGSIGQVFLDAQTGQPEWAAVRTGFFGTKEAFVPLRNAEWDGRAVHIAYDKDRVRNAPHVDPDSRGLAPDQQIELYTYYGFTESAAQPAPSEPGSSLRQAVSGPAATSVPAKEDRSTGAAISAADREREPVQAYADEPEPTTVDGRYSAASSGASGGDTSADTDTSADIDAPEDDVEDDDVKDDDVEDDNGAITRSEEHLEVAVERAPTERVRLHKQIVTEEETVTVTIRREELRIERVPISAEEAAAMGSGQSVGETETEIILYEERPVVTTVRRPVERIRLTRESIEQEETVRGEVRRERIAMDDRDAS